MRSRTLSLMVALVAAGALFAQDGETKSDGAAPEVGASAGGEPAKSSAKIFSALPFCQVAITWPMIRRHPMVVMDAALT